MLNRFKPCIKSLDGKYPDDQIRFITVLCLLLYKIRITFYFGKNIEVKIYCSSRLSANIIEGKLKITDTYSQSEEIINFYPILLYIWELLY